MPVNRLALIRYKTIDNCLRNRYRKWTIYDLVDACSEALYEFEGKSEKVSLRTIQLDIQNMRSEKLGYNAPIIVVDKKYYTYSDDEYSITNMPLTSNDLKTLSQITHTLKQFEGFNQFSDMEEVLKKIENKIFAINNKSQTIIDFEKNNSLKGIKHLDIIYKSILKKNSLKIVYLSFNSPKPIVIHISPYLLKEYRNRWFLFGKNKRKKQIMTLALDRMLRIRVTEEFSFEENTYFDSESYFKDIIGVTRYENTAIETIEFWVEKTHVPYVVTKPFHASQKLIEKNEDGAIFTINVIPNYEMEREFIGFGEFLKILNPIDLQNKFVDRIKKMQNIYN